MSTEIQRAVRLPAQRRQIGDTDVAVTVMGLGTAPLGNLYEPISDEQAVDTVHAALAEGVTTFDTAPHYGLGLSERRVGPILQRQQRSDITVVTKVGRQLEPAPADWAGEPNEPFAVPPTTKRRWDFSAAGVRSCLESSLDRLGLDYVDMLLIHDPENHMRQAVTECLPALVDLRAAGVVKAIGVGTKSTAALTELIDTGHLDVALMAGRYTLLEQGALADVLPAAVRNRTSILIAGVFNSGLLARHQVPDQVTYDYRQAPPEILARAREIAEVCEKHGVSLPDAAMRFPLGHSSVAGLIVGARSPEEVTADAAMLDVAVPAALWEDLRQRGLLGAETPVPTI